MTEIKPRPNDEVVDSLRTLLAQAESGELQAIGWCAVKTRGMTESGAVGLGGNDVIALLGESVLLSRAIARIIEDRLTIRAS